MRYKILMILAVFCLWGAQTGRCADEQSESEEWYPPSAGLITTWTAPLCDKGQFIAQPFVFYNRSRGTFDDQGHYDSLPSGDKKSQVQEQIFLQYGITDKLEISGQALYQQNYAKVSGVSARDQGIGDSYMYLRYGLLDDKKVLPDVTAIFQLKMPTGKYQKADPDKLETDLMGTGSWDYGYGLVISKRLKPFMLHADFIYSFPQRVDIDEVKTQYANYLSYDVGIEYFLPKGFNLALELNGFTQGDTKEDGERTPASDSQSLTLSPGIGWSNDKIQALLAYQRTILGTGVDANDSVAVTFIYNF